MDDILHEDGRKTLFAKGDYQKHENIKFVIYEKYLYNKNKLSLYDSHKE